MEEENEFVNAVFSNDMLRERILDFAIHLTNDIICRKTLCSIRRVQMSWKSSISDAMRKNKEPLHKVVLDGNNSISGTPHVQSRGKILDEFLNFILNRNETFCLYIKPEFFRLENHQSLLAVFRQANEKLVELEMLVPFVGGSLPCVFSNLNLPNLQKLSIQLTNQILENLERDSGVFQHPINIILLLQSLLNRNESLKTLTIQHDRNMLPGIQYISLPTTITKLSLDGLLTDQEMEVLVQTKLPNLNSLSFFVPNRLLPLELISQILNNYRATLKHLYMKTQTICRPPILTNQVNFPVMEKLESLNLISMHTEIDPRIHGWLYQCFPKLKTLKCALQTQEIFQPWIDNSKLSSVTSLTLQIIDYTELFASRRSSVLPSVQILQGIKQSMPNVCNLQLIIEAGDALGLRDLLGEMIHIRSLRLSLRGEKSVPNSDLWDSLLTGIPIEIVTGLRANPGYWENFEVKEDNTPSIRLLKWLSVLSLETSATVPEPLPNNGESGDLISHLSFKFALNKMTNLRILSLVGRFKTSDDVILAWKNQGRRIICA